MIENKKRIRQKKAYQNLARAIFKMENGPSLSKKQRKQLQKMKRDFMNLHRKI